jgi:hypothetical protein
LAILIRSTSVNDRAHQESVIDMWQHYRKTFVPMQLGIILICCVLYFKMNTPLPVTGVYFLVMEAAAFIGAMWAARLRSRITSARGRLPLTPK